MTRLSSSYGSRDEALDDEEKELIGTTTTTRETEVSDDESAGAVCVAS
jgi:hypothetical protein